EQLAAADELRRFRYLHFATHGDLDPRFPLNSFIALAQDRLPDPVHQVLAGKEVYDGRLTAERILHSWRLNADLVTLSACKTGISEKFEGGEGFVGFAQALFLAGTRSLVLSLWEVDSQATTLLMIRFYQNLLGKREGLTRPLPKAEALREAKQWLRNLTAKEVDELEKQFPGRKRGGSDTPEPKMAPAFRPYQH